MRTILPPLLAVLAISSTWLACRVPEAFDDPTSQDEPAPRNRLRVGLFNIRELSAEKLADVGPDGAGRDPQVQAAAAVIRRVRPDVLVLQEIDRAPGYGEGGVDGNARRFVSAYLDRGADPLSYRYLFDAAVNTGLLSGLDLDRDGVVAGEEDLGTPAWGGDSFGWGVYPGQYAMAVLSNVPLDRDAVRTFQRFRWSDLPGNHLPAEFFGEVAGALRLSSKAHWDLPVHLGDERLHLLISHPTPPVFDGPEDRNGRRNFDEIAFWARYLDGDPALVDDRGGTGGLPPGEPFVVVGDLNADPVRGEVVAGAGRSIDTLLQHPGIQDSGTWLTSRGALAARQPGPPEYAERATAVFNGGMRLDYLLPAAGIGIVGGGVFWPDPGEDPEGSAWAAAASDHRMVWIDLELEP